MSDAASVRGDAPALVTTIAPGWIAGRATRSTVLVAQPIADGLTRELEGLSR